MLFNQTFSHIYVEKNVLEHWRTKEILAHFSKSTIVVIDHYKDVFCRTGQNSVRQRESKNLIIARKDGELLYEGASVCQSFGNEHFYYTSCVMNCVYDCEYCYLKGMYPSGHMVVFVNLEDYFAQIEAILQKQSMYICVSYDTDLMALDGITGETKLWSDFVRQVNAKGYIGKLSIEIRTKSANRALVERIEPQDGVIFAFTISPRMVADAYEKKAPGMDERIKIAKLASELGHPVRICLDPMIYCADWQKEYGAMLDTLEQQLDWSKILDVSVGSFRVSQDFLKKMRKEQPDSAVLQFPYENVAGYYQYPEALRAKMEKFLVDGLKRFISSEKIYGWKEEHDNA